jgi:general secretion pathway protein G
VLQRYREIKQRRDSGEYRDYGFTLIELLIVIVVLGILAAIVIFSLTGVTGQSAQAACTADAKTVEIAVDAYNAENTGFPADSTSLLSTTALGGPYLHTWPSNTPHYSITINTLGTVYVAAGTAATVAYDGDLTTGATGGPTGCYAVK